MPNMKVDIQRKGLKVVLLYSAQGRYTIRDIISPIYIRDISISDILSQDISILIRVDSISTLWFLSANGSQGVSLKVKALDLGVWSLLRSQF